MSQFGNWIAVIAALLIANGCSRTPELARGPIEVAESPTSVRFVQPVPSSGSAWELCFEFDRPGDSHHADDIRAVLLSADGQRHPLVETRLDRRGESVVCQIGRAAPMQAGAEGTAKESSAVYVAVELSASVPVRLRGLRGAGR